MSLVSPGDSDVSWSHLLDMSEVGPGQRHYSGYRVTTHIRAQSLADVLTAAAGFILILTTAHHHILIMVTGLS